MRIELIINDNVKPEQLKAAWVVWYFVLAAYQCFENDVFDLEHDFIVGDFEAVEVLSKRGQGDLAPAVDLVSDVDAH